MHIATGHLRVLPPVRNIQEMDISGWEQRYRLQERLSEGMGDRAQLDPRGVDKTSGARESS